MEVKIENQWICISLSSNDIATMWIIREGKIKTKQKSNELIAEEWVPML